MTRPVTTRSAGSARSRPVPRLFSALHGALRRDCTGRCRDRWQGRSFDTASGKSALHMVTAWGCDQRLVLAQIATDAKSNEITAVPRLLEMLSLKGTIVTVDALNCQRDIAQRIVERGGDYVLALKGNQATLHSDVRLFLDDPETRLTDAHTTVDGDHGRIETRTCTVSTDVGWLQEVHDWPGLAAIGKVIRMRESGAKVTTETA